MSARRRGFTLVEVLVATTLLGLVMALAFAALRVSARTGERMTAHIEQLASLRGSQQFLRARLAEARPVRFSDGDRTPLAFLGQPDGLTWVAPAPAQQRLAGELWRYALRFVPGEGRLELAWSPYTPGMPVSGTALEAVHPLSQHLERAAFSYYGPQGPGQPAAWHREWADEAGLPRLVRLQVEARGRADRQEWCLPIRIEVRT